MQLFYLSWLGINLLQASATELLDDEAYYWMYSKFPAWGYFDHPPMIAVLIKAGYALFRSELGVRFFMVCMSTATLYLTEQLTEKKDDVLFFSICASIALAQIGGILAVPDIPLLFFVSIFFLVYKRFVTEPAGLNTILLGISVALMLYSKYHGILVVFFAILSNPKLLLKYQFYFAAAISLLIFFPHLYWQYSHGFPSVQYHLFERNAGHYNVSYTLEYLLGQIAMAGPLIGWLFLWAAFRHKPVSVTERALKFTFYGFYLFFLLSSLKGRVEANWTAPAFVCLIVLSHQYIVENISIRKWVYKTVPFTLFIVVLARIYMLPIVNTAWLPKNEFHGNQAWVKAVEEKAGLKPVVMINSYQKASKFSFYSGKLGFSLNTASYRRNNYNFWPIEDSLLNKQAYVLGAFDPLYLSDSFTNTRLKESGGRNIDQYFSLSRIQLLKIKDITVKDNVLSLSVLIKTPPHYLPLLQTFPLDTARVYIGIYKDTDLVQYIRSGFRARDIHTESSRALISIPVNIPKGIYSAKLAISNAIIGQPSLNSTSFKFKID